MGAGNRPCDPNNTSNIINMNNEQKLYRMYDPSRQAYVSLTKEDALKFIASAKEVEEQIKSDASEGQTS